MCDGDDASNLSQGTSPPAPPDPSRSVVLKPSQVSQGVQVGGRRPPLLHHSSEYLLGRGRVQPQRPYYTARSGQPPLDPLSFPSYLARVTARPTRHAQPYISYNMAESPTSSLDCLTIKGDAWNNGDIVSGYPGKINNGFLHDEQQHRRLGTPVSGNSSRGGCQCPCRCGHVPSGDPEPPSPQSAEGLSWRRLHMSRAKLKATATTSELLSGFAMIAMVELQINEPTNVPEWLFVMFAVCTTVLVAVHIFALMISTYLLPNIDAVSKMSAGDVLRESPHERMRGFIELAWAFSTVLGLFLFLVEVAILCWVKFWDYSFVAATAATVIVIPVLIVFVAFAVHFYHSLVVHKCEASTEDLEQLESMKRNLDSVVVTKTNSPV